VAKKKKPRDLAFTQEELSQAETDIQASRDV
jgi:hypothetical protein